jgi:hypothetical protein
MSKRKATSFMATWLSDPAAYPIIGVIAGACSLSVFAGVRFLTMSPEVHWNKRNRMSPIVDEINSKSWNSHRRALAFMHSNRINEHRMQHLGEKAKQS